MAKKRTSKKAKLTRRQHSLRRRDERIQRILTWSAIGVGTLIVLILAYGAITELIIKPQRPVAKVGEEKITTKAYQSRVRYERLMLRYQILQYEEYLSQIDTSDPQMQTFAQQIQQTKAQLENELSPELAPLFGKDVLDQMVEERLVRQKAAEEGLSVSDAAVTSQIEQMMGFDREAALEATTSPTMTVTETQAVMTEADYRETYANFKVNMLQEAGMSEAAFREMVKTDLLRTKVLEAVTQDVAQEAEQAQVTYFATPTEEEAMALRERILAGEEVEALVEEVNSSENEETLAQTLSWYPQEYLAQVLGEDLAETAFTLPVGTISKPQPDASEELYYLIYVGGREVRALSEALLQQEKQEAYQAWLQEQKEAQVTYLDWESVTPDEP
ncbi:MAG: SurA N-terminal domain-containing protein [Anaerolineae bacterium]